MSQFALLGKRRFAPFFWTQALGAFNDNAFRNALVMMVAFQMGLDDHTVSLYTNLAPALFIIPFRSEEHTSELQSLMRISYAVFCLKKKKTNINIFKLNV